MSENLPEVSKSLNEFFFTATVLQEKNCYLWHGIILSFTHGEHRYKELKVQFQSAEVLILLVSVKENPMGKCFTEISGTSKI